MLVLNIAFCYKQEKINFLSFRKSVKERDILKTTPPLVNLRHTQWKTLQFWYLVSVMTPAGAIKFSPLLQERQEKEDLSLAARDTYF